MPLSDGSLKPELASPVSASLSAEVRYRLEVLAEMVAKWSPTINLISHRDLPDIWERHILDSLVLAAHMHDPIERAIDLGSGAGFPGLVLAIATRTPFVLIESDVRKAAFLTEAARVTGATVTVWPVRIEQCTAPPARLITARALAPLPRLIAMARPLLSQGGKLLLLKGANAQLEIRAAKQTANFTATLTPAQHGNVITITDIGHA